MAARYEKDDTKLWRSQQVGKSHVVQIPYAPAQDVFKLRSTDNGKLSVDNGSLVSAEESFKKREEVAAASKTAGKPLCIWGIPKEIIKPKGKLIPDPIEKDKTNLVENPAHYLIEYPASESDRKLFVGLLKSKSTLAYRLVELYCSTADSSSFCPRMLLSLLEIPHLIVDQQPGKLELEVPGRGKLHDYTAILHYISSSSSMNRLDAFDESYSNDVVRNLERARGATGDEKAGFLTLVDCLLTNRHTKTDGLLPADFDVYCYVVLHGGATQSTLSMLEVWDKVTTKHPQLKFFK